MKKTFLPIYFICAGIVISNLPAEAGAQITVTQSDVAGAGNVMQQAHDTEKDTMPGSINPGPSGANQTWIFSTLLSSTVDTLTFTNPASLPNGSNFPSANLAIVNSTDGSEIYLENISSGLFVDGAYSDPFGLGAMTLTFNPREQLAKFTTSYTTAFQDTSMAQGDFPFTLFRGVDSARFKHIVYKDVLTDGWGNITTPLGTYNSLRNRGKVITIDSAWLHNINPPGWFPAPPPYDASFDTAWHFSWWANGIGFPLLEFDSTAGDTIRNISWIKTLPYASISETASLSGVSVYPNPSTGKFSIESKGEISVYNCIGEKVFMKTSASGKTELDLSSQNSGIYFLHISNEKGTATRKIIISK